jgi:Raf kinase inhibitor-like YbhB/YbcL family protein
MELTSPDFENNGLIPSRFTCDGENVNPTLEIKNIPEETESLTLIMDDPDAPNGTYTHWTVWNMDPSTETIITGSLPVGAIEGETSFGETGYGGPCPPSGTHRYFFKLFALSSELDLPPSTKVEELMEAIEAAKVEECELVGLYTRDSGE